MHIDLKHTDNPRCDICDRDHDDGAFVRHWSGGVFLCERCGTRELELEVELETLAEEAAQLRGSIR